MPLLEAALETHLTEDADVSALVGTRVYPLRMPDKPELPAIVYQKIDAPREYAHDGPSGLAHPLLQISCWGATYKAAKELADKVRIALGGLNGALGTGGPKVGAFIEGEADDDEDARQSLGARMFRTILDVRMWQEETT